MLLKKQIKQKRIKQSLGLEISIKTGKNSKKMVTVTMPNATVELRQLVMRKEAGSEAIRRFVFKKKKS